MSTATQQRERHRISGCENCKARKARISAHLGRFRDSTRLTARVSRSDLVPVRRFHVQTDVPPGSRVPISVTIGNNASVILPTEPDVCTTGGFNGYSLEVVATAGGQLIGQQTECVSAAGSGREFDFEFIAPQEGTTAVTIEVRGANTGNLLHTLERQVTVTQEAPPPETPDGDGDGGFFGGPLLPCFADPNRSCSRFESIGWTAAAAFLLVALAS